MSVDTIDPIVREEVGEEQLSGSFTVALSFLKDVQPAGPWPLTAIQDGVLMGATFGLNDGGELSRFIRDHCSRRNIFWQINSIHGTLRRGRNKASLEEVKSLDRLHADIDPNPDAPGTLEEQRAAILALLQDEARLKEAGIPGKPTHIVDSGGGFWAFWDLVEPYKVEGNAQERRELAHSLGGYNKWIAERLNKAFGWSFSDHCHNIDRIARLPGTVNVPDAKKRAKGRKAALATRRSDHEDATRLYSLDDFQWVDVGLASAGDADIAKVVIEGTYEPLPVHEDGWEASEELMRRYPNIGELTRQLILLGDYVDKDNYFNLCDKQRDGTLVLNRSRAFHRVNRALQHAGVPLPMIVDVLSDERFNISAHARQPDGAQKGERRDSDLKRFVEHQVRKAAANIAKEKEREAELLAQLAEAEAVLAGKPLEEQILEAPAAVGAKAAEAGVRVAPEPRELQFSYNDKKVPHPTERNYLIAFKKLGISIRYNVFSDKDEITGLEGFGPELTDKAMIRLWLTVERRFNFKCPKEAFYDMVTDLSFDKRYHPILNYLDGLVWDGVPRLDTWLPTYSKAKDTPYVRAVGRLMLVAAVRRLREPGCKFDEMAIFEGPQGTNKSTALKILAVNEDWYIDNLPLGSNAKEMIELLSGKWIVEIAEMYGKKGTDPDKIKAQLSRSEDRARLTYGRLTTARKRQCVFFGTTNESKYLKDPTGERRFWPVHVEGFNIDALRADRDQLWAEAVHAERAGESIRMDRALWAEAAQEQGERSLIDPWQEILEGFFGERAGKIRSIDLWDILSVPKERRSQKDTGRLAAIMTTLGFKNASLRFKSHPRDERTIKARGYVRGDGHEAEQQIYLERSDDRERYLDPPF